MKSASWRGGLSIVVLLVAATGGARADGLLPGLWRIISKPEMNGVAYPPMQNMKCLTPEDVADLDKTFSAVSRTTNSTCERVEHEFSPQRLKWRLQCRGELDMDVAGEFIFATPERYTGTVTGSSSMLGRLMQSTRVTLEAQWVGACR
jgi:hypothetical protein